MFQGYSQETVDFMWGIRFNNERGWFLAHKDDYQQHLLAPTRELAIQIRDELRDLCAFKEGVRVVCLYGGPAPGAADSEGQPHLPGRPAAPRSGALQGPSVVLRPHRGPGLDRPPHLLF